MSVPSAGLCALPQNPNAPVCRPDSPALATRGVACEGHYARIERLHAEIEPARRLMLAARFPGMSNGLAEKVSGSSERRDAMNVTAADLADRLSDLLGATPVWIVAQSPADALHWVTQLHDTLSQANGLVPWRVEAQKLKARCPQCFSFGTVVRNGGEDHGTCRLNLGGCGRRISEGELAQMDADWQSEIGFQLAEAAAQRQAKEAA